MTRILALVLAFFLAACLEPGTVPPEPVGPPAAPVPPKLDAATAARNFRAVVATVEPVAERECRARMPGANCDFRIVVDDRPNQPPNAFQTLDGNGRPVIAFTVALIGEARNRDELAFILGHEAAHHIEGHIAKTRQTAIAGAILLGTLASVTGANASGVRTAQDLGATVGARTYSKDYELEADALGTVIAYRAGYDPRRGAEFFFRIRDPGNRFLGTHPPNAERRATVYRTMATLRR